MWAPFIAQAELGTLEHSPVMIMRVATCGGITAKSGTPFQNAFSMARPVNLQIPEPWDNDEFCHSRVFRIIAKLIGVACNQSQMWRTIISAQCISTINRLMNLCDSMQRDKYHSEILNKKQNKNRESK